MEARENVGQGGNWPCFCAPKLLMEEKKGMGKFIIGDGNRTVDGNRAVLLNSFIYKPVPFIHIFNKERSFTQKISPNPSTQMESTDDECTKGFLQGDELKQLGDEMSLADEFMGLIGKDELMGSAEKKAKLDKKDADKPEEKAEDEEIQILGGNSKKQPPKLKQSKLKLEPKKKAKKSARPMKEKPKHEEDSEDSEPVPVKKKKAAKKAKADDSDSEPLAKKKVAKKAKDDNSSDSDRPPAKKKGVKKTKDDDSSDSDRPPAKKKVVKKAKDDGSDDDSGWEPDWESDDGKDDEEKEEHSDDGDESEAGNEEGGKKGKFDWIFKTNRIIQTFGQCGDCIEQQKSLDPVVIQNRHGLFVRLVQCRKCFSANGRIRQVQEGFLERGKSFEFFEETDDYKTAATTYVRAIGQCQYCRNKMGRLEASKMVEKLGKSHICLLLAQCTTCVGRNKQLQRMHWDAFSSLFKGKKGGGAGGGTGGGKKRKIKREEDEDEDDDAEELMPKKAAKKMKK